MENKVDLATWSRAGQFQFFRGFQRPHYAVTCRIDVTRAMALKKQGLSVYRASIYAIGAGLHAVPELCMRFRGEEVVRHDQLALSMTVPTSAASFAYAYVPFLDDFKAFDTLCRTEIERAAMGALNPNTGERDDVAYLSCLPWMDYTATNNAIATPNDCIPRVSWGKIVPKGQGWDMAMTLEVHHALVDGEQVGGYFTAVQSALDGL